MSAPPRDELPIEAALARAAALLDGGHPEEAAVAMRDLADRCREAAHPELSPEAAQRARALLDRCVSTARELQTRTGATLAEAGASRRALSAYRP